MTEVSPIKSGTEAATSEPNVIRSRISVIGIDSMPALARSSLIVLLTAFLELAAPICSTARSG